MLGERQRSHNPTKFFVFMSWLVLLMISGDTDNDDDAVVVLPSAKDKQEHTAGKEGSMVEEKESTLNRLDMPTRMVAGVRQGVCTAFPFPLPHFSRKPFYCIYKFSFIVSFFYTSVTLLKWWCANQSSPSRAHNVNSPISSMPAVASRAWVRTATIASTYSVTYQGVALCGWPSTFCWRTHNVTALNHFPGFAVVCFSL